MCFFDDGSLMLATKEPNVVKVVFYFNYLVEKREKKNTG